MILLLDNYDSFVFNLARYLRELGEEVRVIRNDEITVAGIESLAPSHIVISPGPCTPLKAGISLELVRSLGKATPTLGVCLGHQCIGAAYGGRIVRAEIPMHGKVSEIEHDGSGLFRGLPNPISGTRYHSLLLDRPSVPSDLRITAWTSAGDVMAIEHQTDPVWGVQFHPEAIMTECGHQLLANFLALGRGETLPGGTAAIHPPAELV
jgi:anthranilate synthase/aminodeoxychorismate synthase-like glutamine amidotransferase